ncbi:Mitochondrial enolase superfamily member 1 [Tupaia chinensis]|uniref:Mitochondrial enolase superfamily member 1 n=1 Tax=Tupaia chinensis TaxID=246437 RepID=L9KMU3_TUPCH|nr:Mitochondrial enolase superfamily member 1 [Tupaia chinensis]
MVRGRICRLSVRDVRFPTSLGGHGSDAMHTDPDYSAAYVVIETDAEDGLKGYGITFTLGKGTEVDWSGEGRGAPGNGGRPKCGVGPVGKAGGQGEEIVHSHAAGEHRAQDYPVGPGSKSSLFSSAAELLRNNACPEDPRTLLSCIDFRYITDVLTEEEAYEEQMLTHGYPAYTTSCAWLGYSDDTLKQLCTEALKDGWTRFKVKVGADLKDDMRRCRLIRDMIGPEKALCHNRVIFKQLLQANALQFLQIDSCRLGSVNENLSVLLMAKKFEIPVCPHAGGVGLCELVQHLIIFDYISVSTSLQNRMCEYVDHLHEHFKYPVTIKQASYMPPQDAGYSTEMKEESVQKHQYPDGEVWKKLLAAQEN